MQQIKKRVSSTREITNTIDSKLKQGHKNSRRKVKYARKSTTNFNKYPGEGK